MDLRTRFKIIKYLAWALSVFALTVGVILILDPTISHVSKILASILVQAGGASFFALTVGWAIDRVRDFEGYSVLWLFSQEFREAGVLGFYADRRGHSEMALEEAFRSHKRGEILLVGPSLRLFLASGHHFYPMISEILGTKRNSSVTVRAIYSNADENHELPVRSFIEEFNQDGTFPRSRDFDWSKDITFDFRDFERDFFQRHGNNAPPADRLRVITDLQGTRAGITALEGIAASANNRISHWESRFAPYCTLVIFPDRAFFTPNLLSCDVPVNLPIIVFHKSSMAYRKLKDYFEFLWWLTKGRED